MQLRDAGNHLLDECDVFGVGDVRAVQPLRQSLHWRLSLLPSVAVDERDGRARRRGAVFDSFYNRWLDPILRHARRHRDLVLLQPGEEQSRQGARSLIRSISTVEVVRYSPRDAHVDASLGQAKFPAKSAWSAIITIHNP